MHKAFQTISILLNFDRLNVSTKTKLKQTYKSFQQQPTETESLNFRQFSTKKMA